MSQPKCVVMFSGGVGSWAAARRAVERYGADDVALLFADTTIEDQDLYRFLDQAAADVGAELHIVRDGRDIWQVFKDHRLLGNSRIAKCSHVLKQVPARAWMTENAPDAVVVLGIDWSEEHRLPGAVRGWQPWEVWAPLCEEPFVTKLELLRDLGSRGIEAPLLYRQGFAHNNCGGGCVRSGEAQFVHLMRTRPETFAAWEQGEADVRDFLGKDVAILRTRAGGVVTPLPLSDLRKRVERQPSFFDSEDWGGCGCFVSDDEGGGE